MNQNIQWMVIGPVRITNILLKFFNHGQVSSLSLFLTHSMKQIPINRFKNLVAVNSYRTKNHKNVS